MLIIADETEIDNSSEQLEQSLLPHSFSGIHKIITAIKDIKRK